MAYLACRETGGSYMAFGNSRDKLATLIAIVLIFRRTIQY
jgi:hypothetical protein